MSIGEVLGILKPEFPDITVSKIRFLEGAGLVQPDRSASGYRKFSEDDVARLRFVLRAQRDQYLPLRVIRQRLADLEQVGSLDAKGGPSPVPGAAPASPSRPGGGSVGGSPGTAGGAGAGS
ncbi:MAG TPA: MerR family transcriptional regulator, partial [Actinomycetota bacterium]|nr:MerR family transcriptional regulator [Actinomycetota bacterium]